MGALLPHVHVDTWWGLRWTSKTMLKRFLHAPSGRGCAVVWGEGVRGWVRHEGVVGAQCVVRGQAVWVGLGGGKEPTDVAALPGDTGVGSVVGDGCRLTRMKGPEVRERRWQPSREGKLRGRQRAEPTAPGRCASGR